MMPFTVPALVRLALRSLSTPKVVMREVLEFQLSRAALLLLTVLLVVLDLMSGLAMEIVAPDALGAGPGPSSGIISFFALHLLTILGGAAFLFLGGRKFGGHGDFDQCFKAIIWLNFVFFLLQFVAPVARVLSVQLEEFAFLGMAVLGFVQLTAYVMVVHGFTRIFPVVFGVLGAQLLFGVVLVIFLAMLGIGL